MSPTLRLIARGALQVLREEAISRRGVLTLTEVEALEAMANSQAEMLKVLAALPEAWRRGDPDILEKANAAFKKARGE